MMIPTVHMNGTTGKELLAAQLDAARAVKHAMERLALACPNARDFYTQGPTAISTAISEHAARMRKLREVLDELRKIALGVNDQIPEKKP